jgi:hypothetical protein
MKYFVMNGCSPHASMWKESGGKLSPVPGTINPTSLIGVKFEQSNIDDVTREKILNKFPELNIPQIRFTIDKETGKRVDIKEIKGVQIEDHIICICTINEKFVSPKPEDDEDLIIEEYVVVL